MVVYYCDRCGYSTNHRSVFKKHLNRKNICKPHLSNADIATIKERYNFPVETKIYKNAKIDNFPSEIPPKPSEIPPRYANSCIIFPSKIPPKPSEIPPKPSEMAFVEIGGTASTTFEKMKNVCEFCGKKFTRKDNLKRHQNLRCKKMAIVLARKSEESKLEELQSQIDILEEKLVKTNYYQQNNVGDNNIINSNNTLNQHNIVINNYGSENIDYITDKIVQKMIQQGPYSSIPKLLKATHFDKAHPENHNLAITNVRSKYAHIRKDNMWQIRQLNEILEEIILNKFNFIDECFDGGIRSDLPNHKIGIYEDYKDKFKNDTHIRDTIKEKLYEIIVNFTKELGLKCK